MDDASELGLWGVDRDTVRALRLERAHQALERGDADLALVEAEELLDDQPNHHEALLIAGQAALHLGDATMAQGAFVRFLELQPPNPGVLQSLAIACFECADLHGAADAARTAGEMAPEMPDSWYYLGLALERTGDKNVSAQMFLRASSLAPDRFPLPIPIPESQWADILDRALNGLDGPIRSFYQHVPVTWEDFPPVDELRATKPPLSPFTDAMYTGHPPLDADPWTVLPARVRAFRGNLSRPPGSSDEIAARLSRALAHEARHWLGLQEPIRS